MVFSYTKFCYQSQVSLTACLRTVRAACILVDNVFQIRVNAEVIVSLLSIVIQTNIRTLPKLVAR